MGGKYIKKILNTNKASGCESIALNVIINGCANISEL